MKKLYFICSMLILSLSVEAKVQVNALDPSLLMFNECHAESLRISYLSLTTSDIALTSLPDEVNQLLNNSHIIVLEQSVKKRANLSSVLKHNYDSQDIALTRKQKRQKASLGQQILTRQQMNAGKAYRPQPLLGSFDIPPWVLNFNFADKRLVLSSTITNKNEKGPQQAEVATLQKFLASTKRPNLFIFGNDQATSFKVSSSKTLGHQWWLLDTLRACKNQDLVTENYSLSSIQFSEF
ncbi:hypothetical protein DBZ36_03850 [Alginatibacterium sediminis]|uniref:Uncharacterized protein n=1 Tax=Alginatibacterium sediminis TaxID=2164068 RepID=A0A420EG20_9ALTE|nr:hypothetical protein [Alginatibacterium sediminis]RKF19610.1 hypothetical protein DBZ36_03850 [Alginatibacterium sediminis]